jgi:hypothetical protein
MKMVLTSAYYKPATMQKFQSRMLSLRESSSAIPSSPPVGFSVAIPRIKPINSAETGGLPTGFAFQAGTSPFRLIGNSLQASQSFLGGLVYSILLGFDTRQAFAKLTVGETRIVLSQFRC